ncbi:HlyD family secretion protein [Rhizobium rhizosphaerae]|uniref:HlyD family secretion protein n=1 Tax=Xaviernesmea rhizosphaerae TaxID=1672749 RepID=UPI0009BD5EA3|nr:HlyD family secretion protein [Xaviernesmea rhizosphaerae]
MTAEPHSSSPAAREARSPASSTGGSPPQPENAADGNKSEAKKPSILRRHPLWILFGLLAVAAICIAGYFVWLIYFHPYESTDDAFVEARSFAIATKAAGYVATIDVTDNQHVDAGARLMTIDPTDYQIALDQAKGQVESARAAIESAEAQIAAAGAAIDEARAQQTSAAAALQFAQEEANRQQDLAKSGAGTVQTAQQATSSLRQAQANAAQTQASVVSAMKNKAVAEAQRANAIASLHQAEAGAAAAEQKLKDTVIIAQQAGRVVQLSGAKGQFVTEGQSLAMFVPDEVWVVANFKETQLTDMRPGQAVALSIDAYPDHPLTGKVESIQPGSGTAFSLLPAENATGNYVKVTQRVPVKITVDRWPADVPVGPGMSVVPTVTVRPRS